MTGSEIVRAEQFEIERFRTLGLSRYEAIRAVEDGIDWYALAALVKSGYPVSAALESARRS
jgi:hypothetical protein